MKSHTIIFTFVYEISFSKYTKQFIFIFNIHIQILLNVSKGS